MKSIELVCINYGNIEDAKLVVNHCLDVFPRLEKATIFHPSAIKSKQWKVEIVRAIRGSQHLTTLIDMPCYLTCDFALSIQWDGFIIRADFWDERFLDYDYIAPPWPLQNIINKDHRVGSGGFCLFSRKLAEFWQENGDPEIPNDWERGAVNRKKYENAGFTFAPIDLALKFGKEHNLEDVDYPEGESFGFHDFRINTERRQQFKDLVYGHRND